MDSGQSIVSAFSFSFFTLWVRQPCVLDPSLLLWEVTAKRQPLLCRLWSLQLCHSVAQGHLPVPLPNAFWALRMTTHTVITIIIHIFKVPHKSVLLLCSHHLPWTWGKLRHWKIKMFQTQLLLSGTWGIWFQRLCKSAALSEVIFKACECSGLLEE